MMEFIFVAIMCIGTKCDFMASDIAVPETHCIKMKEQFLTLPFKPEITLAAAQCMKFNQGKNV
jgi:hypothetical protein